MALGCDWTKQQADSRTFLTNKSKERNMFAAEHFLSNIVRDYGSIQSQQMVAHGTRWLEDFLD